MKIDFSVYNAKVGGKIHAFCTAKVSQLYRMIIPFLFIDSVVVS